MNLNAQTPKIILNKAFLKQRPLRSEIELFKGNLKILLEKVKAKESEENKKNHVRDFLLNTYYKDKYEVNTKDRKDLVIHLDKTNESNVGVIIEAKSPDNRAEMLKLDKTNAKALQELVLYYFDERQTKSNSELKKLVITNAYEWFIFDANVFDKKIYRNAQIRRLYETYKNDKKDNPFFYEELRQIFDNSDEEITCTYFNLKDYESVLNNADLEDDKDLIALFKILSPIHLLKLPFADDSNSLNKPFYDELLHIIGLEEIKIKSKSIIRRKEEGNRNQGSLLENAMTILKTKDSLRRIKNIADYGAGDEERYFNVALELCIVWINRILFLKLLESQLVSYHKGNRDYQFLNIKTIPDFDELFTLFHQILAKTFQDREENIREKYSRVPYLNSSLFEIGELEDLTISIESLKDTAHLPFINSTVLKRQKAENQTFGTLEYLFNFLDAYDFASEGAEDVQEDNRSLINASVLGKVFEKINGYKDGSIFTPGFITMYMCRQAIRLAVVQKFKDKYAIDVDSFDELKNFIGNVYKTEKIREYNELVNSLHLCDPAVGSGHFLVSSLNEIIAVKSELGLLADESGVRLSDYQITIENDELIITDEKGDFFSYQLNDGKPTAKAQRLQKTLFHEKRTLIENCLFGVDINPNSVKICRLRLWIELLKNAYYKEDSYTELETLPNIDINIKQGNSLLSRFALNEDLTQILKQIKYGIEDYRNFVLGYKETLDREKKREFEAKIKQIKDDFKTQLFFFSPERRKLADFENQLKASESKQFLFGESDEEKAKRFKDEETLRTKIKQAQETVKQIEENAIYKNAFEWRFEFPEVLDDEGNFTGFDIVIGNPPYIRQEELGTLKDYLKKDYQVYSGMADILVYFYELGINILTENGKFSFITSNKFMRANYGKALRDYLWQQNILDIIDFGELPVFDEVATFPVILDLEKAENQKSVRFTQVKTLKFDSLYEVIKENSNVLSKSAFEGESWTLANSKSVDLLGKIKYKSVALKEYLDIEIRYGIKTGFNEAFVIDEAKRAELISEDPKSIEVIKQFAIGDDIRKWKIKPTKSWLIYIPWHFPLHEQKIEGASETAEIEFRKNYPAIYKHLEQYKSNLISRNLTETGVRYEWYALQRFGSTYWQDFEKPKIIYPVIAKEPRFAFSDSDFYINDKCFFIAQNDLFLLAYLNSKVAWFYLKNICSVLGDADKGGRLELRAIHVQTLPIPKIEEKDRQPFVALVDRILELKKEGKDTQSLENEIDRLVYQLYDLTADEIGIVEGKA